MTHRSSFHRALILLLFFLGFAAHSPGEPRAAAIPSLSGQGAGTVSQQNIQTPSGTLPEHGGIRNIPQEDSTTPVSQKQKADILKFNFKKMKQDADELATLAKSLQEQLDKSNEHILSLDVVNKAEKIEKLAKKIKETARGF